MLIIILKKLKMDNKTNLLKKNLYLEKMKVFIYETNTKFYRGKQSLMNSLKFYKNSNRSIDKEEEKCPICLTKITYKTGINSCKHYFCFRCIYKWTKEKNKCPLCRKTYRKFLKFF